MHSFPEATLRASWVERAVGTGRCSARMPCLRVAAAIFRPPVQVATAQRDAGGVRATKQSRERRRENVADGELAQFRVRGILVAHGSHAVRGRRARLAQLRPVRQQYIVIERVGRAVIDVPGARPEPPALLMVEQHVE